MKYIKKITFLIMPLALSGCGNGESFVSSNSILTRGWARPADPKKDPPLYCYETLGHIDCYKDPLKNPGAEQRLVGTPPPPQKDEDGDKVQVTPTPPSIQVQTLAPIPLHEKS